ncbi:MAG: glycosyltransferase family protein [Parachlamydiaceae bacterium]|nr:glycosyltransferase family protein [Parachlamydiaceae bacterium]
MQVAIFVQARMGSTRLPGKVMMPVLGKPLLEFLTERLARSSEANSYRILTTTESIDDPIADFCHSNHIPCFRGPNEDVLSRYYQAAQLYPADAFVRITADCPLIDPALIDQVISTFRKEHHLYDYMSNSLVRTFPRGMDVEIFTSEALTKAFQNAPSASEREHVTLYMYQNPQKFRCKNIPSPTNLQQYRLTVDTPEDYTLIKLILEDLYPRCPQFTLSDIITLLKSHSDWLLINAHVQQKKHTIN